MMSMMLNSGLEIAEKEKVDRLDGPIGIAFISAGYTDRIFCQGQGDGNSRFLDFRNSSKTLTSVPMDQFMAAVDDAAVAMVVESIHEWPTERPR